MIKFFSRIRRELMETNKTGKYIKYAIGEIVLVVIGILIALSLNNWNFNRLERQEEQRFLMRFKSDIQMQLDQLAELEGNLQTKIDLAESLLADYQAKGSFNKVDGFSTGISKLMRTSSFPNINTTFNEINASGQVGIIRNDSLRSAIIKFYQYNEMSEYGYKVNLQDVFYSLIFPDYIAAIHINFQDFGYESSKVAPNLISTEQADYLAHKLDQPEMALKIYNGISLRLLFTNANKTRISESKNRCIALLDFIDQNLKN